MNNFAYERAGSIDEAIRLRAQPGAAFIGGGTNLLDLMKGGIARPDRLIDINRLPVRDFSQITQLPDGGVRIGAGASNSDAANHPLIRARYPLLTRALLAGASPQLRNMATVGGNLMQRTRCYYFYDVGFQQCNKRLPGSGCAAIGGHNRIHAILGTSASCIATHPSDMSVSLAALRATIRTRGPQGERAIAMADFHRLPGDTPHLDTNLGESELITAVDLPPARFPQWVDYLKVRDRASYAFALVSVAAGLDIRDGVVRDAGLALGGVAHKPWRLEAAEQALIGQPLSDKTVQAATQVLLDGARGFGHNDFKLDLAVRAIKRAVANASTAAATSTIA
ncbi:MAG: xanthine dehydrogenase family protein subunit M [Rubrivivax sp.]|nr:MAG: xanthine dehydrogenase family protein subunit M [Rubrivivax sp.]